MPHRHHKVRTAVRAVQPNPADTANTCRDKKKGFDKPEPPDDAAVLSGESATPDAPSHR